MPAALLARHSLTSCKKEAAKLGLTNIGRPRRLAFEHTLTPIGCGYLAGLIDGEGFCGFQRRGGDAPVIKVTTTDEVIVNWMVSRCPSFTAFERPVLPSGKRCWTVQMSYRIGCAELARLILPYVLIPKKRAALERMASAWP